jgi:hypothetical protein
MHKITRKRRTREHVIADLGVNHVERFVLRTGYTVEPSWHDYGFDLVLHTYDNNGECENGDVRIQVKATDHLKQKQGGRWISCRIEARDVRHWVKEPMPVVLIVYDANKDQAFWLYIQHYFVGRLGEAWGRRASDTLTVNISSNSILHEEAVREFRRFRDNVLTQSQGVIHRHD